MTLSTKFIHSISDVDNAQWDRLAATAGPFLQYSFLHALESTGCVGSNTSWQPYHLVIFDDNNVVAFMPGYLKSDSYGEYVFDHSWADAYHQHGLNYYPKWISAVPFTPVTGARILTLKSDIVSAITDAACGAIESLTRLLPARPSSAHILFSPAHMAKSWQTKGYLRRYSVQFQWYNYNYVDFADFLSVLTSRKRRSLRKSRTQLENEKVTITRISGDQITESDILFFIRCYQQTYLKRSGHTGYLTPEFFLKLYETFSDKLMIVLAEQNGRKVASALFFFDETGLYGRYWGSLEDINGLHFECCYFQGIEFAIERGLPLFNPGTQGEHKILRGFEPTYCVSVHKLFEPVFHEAVANYLERETPAIANYFKDAAAVLPYNEDAISKLKTTSTVDVTPDRNSPKQKSDKNEI